MDALLGSGDHGIVAEDVGGAGRRFVVLKMANGEGIDTDGSAGGNVDPAPDPLPDEVAALGNPAHREVSGDGGPLDHGRAGGDIKPASISVTRGVGDVVQVGPGSSPALCDVRGDGHTLDDSGAA